jgi:hypothetical protein
MAIYLHCGMATLRQSPTLVEGESADLLAVRLRRRLRKALVAYARRLFEPRHPSDACSWRHVQPHWLRSAPRGPAQAERLAHIEFGADQAHPVIRHGVTMPLSDLELDWQRHERATS